MMDDEWGGTFARVDDEWRRKWFVVSRNGLGECIQCGAPATVVVLLGWVDPLGVIEADERYISCRPCGEAFTARSTRRRYRLDTR